VTGQIHSQFLGAFVPRFRLISDFTVPDIAAMDSFDVVVMVPFCLLPPEFPCPGKARPLDEEALCIEDEFWDGGVEVVWSGPAGSGRTNRHLGRARICGGRETARVPIRTNCASSAAWTVNNLCPGFSARLEGNDFSAAPNPIPPGWEGFLAVTSEAGVPDEATCPFAVELICLTAAACVEVAAEVCDACTVPVVPVTWGSIKARYRSSP
jgi:hypothetical protein